MGKTSQTFDPDWVSPPGDTIADVLTELNWSQSELATHLEVSLSAIEQLIKGELIIDNKLASNLAKVLGGTKKFWLTRESQYRKKLSKRNKKN